MERTAKFFMGETGWEAHLYLNEQRVAVLCGQDGNQAACAEGTLLARVREWIESGIVLKARPQMFGAVAEQPAVRGCQNQVRARNAGLATVH